MNGIELIAQERDRQIDQEGWTQKHDSQHQEGELAFAACYYAIPYPLRHICHCGASSFTTPESIYDATGWVPIWAKRDDKDRIRQLAVAGALIAAEIDRLQTGNALG